MTPVGVDIGTRDTRRVMIGGAVSGVLGVSALVGAVSAYADGEGVGGTIALVIGVAFTGIAPAAVLNWKKVSRPRELVFEEPGVEINLERPHHALRRFASQRYQGLGVAS